MMTSATISTHEETQPSLETRAAQQTANAVASRIVGHSPPMERTSSTIAEIVPLQAPVLLVGAPGTGKRFFARMIHELGPLSARPFVVLSAGDSTIDAERLRRIVESAAQATLFIDAIDRLSIELQEVLYKCAFVEEGLLPARVLACCERLLDSDVAAGHFRADLVDVFAANVVCIPSLHDRREDLPELIEYFFGQCTSRARRTDLRGISPEARSVLASHAYFDNVRGLEHAIEHAVAFAQGPYVTRADLPAAMSRPDPVDMTQLLRALPSTGVDLKNAVESFETLMILQALERTGWNKNRAAQLLGLNRTTLVEMIKRKRLAPPNGIRRLSNRDSAPEQDIAAE